MLAEIIEAYKNSPKWFNLTESSKIAYRKPLARLLELEAQLPSPKAYAVAGSRSPFDVAGWNKAIRESEISNNEKNKMFLMLETVGKTTGLFHGSFGKLPHETKQTKPWKKEEVKALWQATLSIEERVAVAFLCFCRSTGMRPWCEARELRWAEVSTYIGVLGSKRREQGKISRKIKVLPETQECLDFIRQMVPKWGSQGFVWVTDKGKRINKDTVRLNLKTACSRLGVEYREMYDARRGLVTALLANGMDIYKVKDLMGHRDVKTTMRYDRRTLDQKADLLVSV